MNKPLNQLCNFLRDYAKSHPKCTKDEISKVTAKEFTLTKKRSVFYRDDLPTVVNLANMRFLFTRLPKLL